MTTDVAPISDAALEFVRKRAERNKDKSVSANDTLALLARLDAAEFETGKYMQEYADALQGKLDVKAERNRLAALNAELIAKHKKVIAWLERLAASAETAADSEKRFLSLQDARLADAKNYRATVADIRAVLPKARPQEPVTLFGDVIT